MNSKNLTGIKNIENRHFLEYYYCYRFSKNYFFNASCLKLTHQGENRFY